MPVEGPNQSAALALAQRVAANFASLSQVEAVAMAGSRTAEFADSQSDIDLYVYVTADIPLDRRARVAEESPKSEIGNTTWEPGDEWIDPATGTPVDVMFRHTRWIEEQLDRVLVRHEASVGYSTCFWYNVLHSQRLFDRTGWFVALQDKAAVDYPSELRKAIIAKNFPLLRRNQSSYLHQIELAMKRNDPVSVNHRVAALLASYFDVLFALNQLPHPGEKRILEHAKAACTKLPVGMEQEVRGLLDNPNSDLIEGINALVDGLERWVAREGLIPDGHVGNFARGTII